MDQRITSVRYDSVARGLHWFSAILVILAFAGGLLADAPPKDWHWTWVNAHALTGLTIFTLVFVRLIWRAGHPPPVRLDADPRETLVIKLGHFALYAGMVVVPLIGLAPLFTRGRGIDFGLFQIAAPIARTQEWVKPATEVHEIAAYGLIALAAGHVALAIWRHVAKKDGTLFRMMGER